MRTREDHFDEDNETLAMIARTAGGLGVVALLLPGVGLAVGAILGTPLLIALHANFPFTERFDPAVILPTAVVLALTAIVAGGLDSRPRESSGETDTPHQLPEAWLGAQSVQPRLHF